MNELLRIIDKEIDNYLFTIMNNQRTFANVSEALHRLRFDHSNTELQSAILDELQRRNCANAMKKNCKDGEQV